MEVQESDTICVVNDFLAARQALCPLGRLYLGILLINREHFELLATETGDDVVAKIHG